MFGERQTLKKNIGGFYKMEELKALFGDGALSYSEFEQKLTEAGDTISLANLKSGNYVDKAKFERLEKGLNDYKAKYSELEASSKGFDELQKQYDDMSSKYNELLAKQDMADKMGKIKSANVNDDFVEFVYSKVNAQVDDNKDFQTALDEYLKEHKQYLNSVKGTYADLEGGNAPAKSANEIMNNLIRGKK